MSITADVIAVDLVANDRGYTAKMGAARQSLTGFQAATVSSSDALERRQVPAFNRAGQGALRLSSSIRQLIGLYGVMRVVNIATNIINNFDDIEKRAGELGIAIDRDLVDGVKAVKDAWGGFFLYFKLGVAAAIVDMSRMGTAADLLNRELGGGKPLATPTQRPQAAARQLPNEILNLAVTKGPLAEARERAAVDAAKAVRDLESLLKKQQEADGDIADTILESAEGRKQFFERIVSFQQFIAQSTRDFKTAADAANSKNLQSDLERLSGQQNDSDFRARREALEGEIEIAESLRDAFDITGAAGMRAFDNIGDAAEQALQQIAAMAFQLGVMEPILSALFGKKGGGLGGIVGSIAASLSGIPSRDLGGPVSAGHMYRVHKDELFVPRVPGDIIPKGGMGGGSIVVNVDARWAQAGVAEQLRAVIPAVIAQAVRQSDSRFARNFDLTMRDKR